MPVENEGRNAVQPGPAGRSLPLPGVPGGTYAWRGALLEAALPVSVLSLSASRSGETLYVMGQTRFANVEIDRTGFHAVRVGSPEPQKTAKR